ncbi:hypothetical protein J41TS12_18270 [Paenibacillus antibioticophila]|uniref:Uncharacterized protein n=1 Tax=Paenibacillus antibioticophila TaxID=1274374 RepID=A0A919XPQ0_9BACL|nr:hypothetical protein [Paenibacillus antibioticophila]GIO36966.1 hypothetical protein J41TS12_18270 [Paenibacillus antibioticophila]
MKRKQSRIEVWFSIGFLFTLIAAFGTFFLGLSLSIERTEAKYMNLKESILERETDASYTQQELLTFYYVAYQPYLQFKNEYLKLESRLSLTESGITASNLIKEVQKSSQTMYNQISEHPISSSSPLLADAQRDILKSLKLFDEGLDKYVSLLGGEKGPVLLVELSGDEFATSAQEYGLRAQNKFYTSIMKWCAKTDSNTPKEFALKQDTTTKEWSGYSLSLKNKAVSDVMLSSKLYVSYQPQDMTAKIDQMINSGKAASLGLSNVSAIVKVLTETEAVQDQEYDKWKTVYYASEHLPALPFFLVQ